MPHRPYVIAVDGPSGAGKSRLASQLARALGDAAVIRLDEMYPGWDGLEPSIPRLVAWALQPAREARPVRWRRWDWAAGRYTEWHQVPTCAVLVVEGVGAGARLCAPYLDQLLWVEAPEPVRYATAMARDGEAYRPHWRRWAGAERAHFDKEGTRERADVVVTLVA